MSFFCGCGHSILRVSEVPNPVIESTVMAEAKLPPRAIAHHFELTVATSSLFY